MKLFVVLLFAAICGLSIAYPPKVPHGNVRPDCPKTCKSPEKELVRRISHIPKLKKEILKQISKLDDGTPVKDILKPENLGPAPGMCLINQSKLK